MDGRTWLLEVRNRIKEEEEDEEEDEEEEEEEEKKGEEEEEKRITTICWSRTLMAYIISCFMLPLLLLSSPLLSVVHYP